VLKDLRHAARMLLQAKGWTAAVVISLALGIGANTALFSAVNGLLLRKVSVKDPDSLVRLRHAGPNDMSTGSSDYGFSAPIGELNVRSSFSYPMYQQLLADNKTMVDLIAGAPFGRVSIVVNGHAEIATAFIASGNYFRMLEISANPGRTLLPDDDRASAPPVMVISHKYWRSRFGGDAGVIGKSVTVNTTPITIVGVIEPSFTGIQQAVQEPADVMLPLALDPVLTPNVERMSHTLPRLSEATEWWLQIVGRLEPGVTAAEAQANLETVFQHTARAGLESFLTRLPDSERNTMRNRDRTRTSQLHVDSAARGIYDASTTDRRAVSILSGIVGLVLLIVCANVANLLLSRAANRQKEVSVRVSLGATRARLIRQLLTESLLLASLGGAIGLVIGQWGKTLLPGAPGAPVPLDWIVLGFVAGVTLLTAFVFGIAPALGATGININNSLKQHSRGVVVSRTWLGRSLLVVQVSISIVLLIGAGLFLRTIQNLRQVDVGFDASNLVMFRIAPQLNGYDESRTYLLYQHLLERFRAVPGVASATLSQPALLSGSVNQTSIFVQGRTYTAGSRDSINRLVVAPGFFEVMGIPVIAGRSLSERDDATAPKAVVINAAAAERYFPNVNPIGQRFGPSPETSSQNEIVGIVRDVKYNSVRDDAPPTMYMTYWQSPRTLGPSITIRTAGEPMSVVGSLREALRQVDPNLPMMNVTTQMEQIELRLVQEKLFAQAYAVFGGLALLIASVGLFGLMSYSVARRTNEIGIRMALGAQPHEVRRMVLGESMTLVVVGVVLGLAIALAAGRLVAALLFGVSATDVTTIALAMTVMLGVAALAGYLPARRASRVDPMVALHDE
jgi:predicted permease